MHDRLVYWLTVSYWINELNGSKSAYLPFNSFSKSVSKSVKHSFIHSPFHFNCFFISSLILSFIQSICTALLHDTSSQSLQTRNRPVSECCGKMCSGASGDQKNTQIKTMVQLFTHKVLVTNSFPPSPLPHLLPFPLLLPLYTSFVCLPATRR